MENGFCSPRSDAFPAGLRVLVVDDDPTWLRILEKMLKKCSYEGYYLLHINFSTALVTLFFDYYWFSSGPFHVLDYWFLVCFCANCIWVCFFFSLFLCVCVCVYNSFRWVFQVMKICPKMLFFLFFSEILLFMYKWGVRQALDAF